MSHLVYIPLLYIIVVMKLTSYRRDLQAHKRALASLLNERKKIDEQIARLQPLINHLEGLCHELGNRAARDIAAKAAMTTGLTNAARATLEEAFGPLTPAELKQRMEAKGFNFSNYSLPLSSLHVVLQRLVKAGQVKVVPRKGSKKAYQWITTVDKLLSVLDTMTKVSSLAGADGNSRAESLRSRNTGRSKDVTAKAVRKYGSSSPYRAAPSERRT
jgi:hypothetical protein